MHRFYQYYCPLCHKSTTIDEDRSRVYREMVKHIKECAKAREKMQADQARLAELKQALEKIDALREKIEGAGAVVTGKRGYLSGYPYVWSTDAGRAFVFKNKEQAESLIKQHSLEAKALELHK